MSLAAAPPWKNVTTGGQTRSGVRTLRRMALLTVTGVQVRHHKLPEPPFSRVTLADEPTTEEERQTERDAWASAKLRCLRRRPVGVYWGFGDSRCPLELVFSIPGLPKQLCVASAGGYAGLYCQYLDNSIALVTWHFLQCCKSL